MWAVALFGHKALTFRMWLIDGDTAIVTLRVIRSRLEVLALVTSVLDTAVAQTL